MSDRASVAGSAESARSASVADESTDLGRQLAGVLAGVLGLDEVSADSHFFEDLGADSLVMARFCARVRKRPDLPSVAITDIYQHPTIARLAGALADPGTPAVQQGLAEVLAGVVGLDHVPADSHFFDDLGADSLVMARFCARVRKREDLPSVSITDIYQHPTIAALAVALTHGQAPTPEAGQPETRQRRTAQPTTAPPQAVQRALAPVLVASTRRYLMCGALQLLIFLGYCTVYTLVPVYSYLYIYQADGLLDIYLRSVVVAILGFTALCTLPIVAKWTLIGRWRTQEFDVWSLAYLRFWVVKSLVRSNPLVLLVPGSPLYSLYLRALGARVGRGVAIFTRAVPVCTDLLAIGDGTVIRKGSALACYRAHAGRIQTGPVTLGRDVLVGERTALDIHTALGDGGQLGHASSLHEGQSIPPGEHWHGSPAQPTTVDYRAVPTTDCGTARRVLYGIGQLLLAVLVLLPLVLGGVVALLTEVPQLSGFFDKGHLADLGWWLLLDAALASGVLLFGTMLVALLTALTVPRLLNRAITPDRVYPLYGFHYAVHLMIVRLTNVKFFVFLLGDSSYIVHYLRAIGYDLSRVEQTGSNFGAAHTHENPYLTSVGTGTMVADGLSVMNADFSSSSFRVSHTAIGPHNFLGNHIAYPAGGRTGADCLLATKAMIPVDGPVREGVGLLGSPSFEIPRSVLRDTSLEVTDRGEFRRLLSAKNRSNVGTIGLALLMRWGHLVGLMLLLLLAADLYRQLGPLALVAELLISLLFTMGYFVLVERAARGFRSLEPRSCSIYDPQFWWHERYWKLSAPQFDRTLVGTPYKNVVSRLLGAKVGRRVFDDGWHATERTLTAIGDDCTLNAGSVIQSHSQEDGAFKSDHSTVGARCTLGVGAFVHYGVTIGDGAVLAADSFLMKGEEVPSGAYWGGNPARDLVPQAALPGSASPPTVMAAQAPDPRVLMSATTRGELA
ncbi:MAG TPA: Pls/PosA family non-ribosomal peptide synthetase [Propionibacteriaceae bacterium]|nr:Pls/PosA family non-ribosomal peptide synthetase [Propionibacteriaceae bacterium]